MVIALPSVGTRAAQVVSLVQANASDSHVVCAQAESVAIRHRAVNEKVVNACIPAVTTSATLVAVRMRNLKTCLQGLRR